jgi:amino acid transporter
MDFGRALFGPIGGSVFAFMVAFSCFGALNGVLRTTISHCPTKLVVLGSFFTSSRLVYAASRERYLPAIFGKLHSTRRTPLNAALLQAAITIAFIMIGSGFRSLINFSVVASWAFYFLTVSIVSTNSDFLIDQPLLSGLGTCHFANKGTDA